MYSSASRPASSTKSAALPAWSTTSVRNRQARLSGSDAEDLQEGDSLRLYGTGSEAARVGARGPLMIAEPTANRLAVGHLLQHIQNQLAIFLFRLAQQATHLVEKTRVFAGTAPRDVVRRLTLWQVRQLWRLFTVVKQLVEWRLESTRQLLQCLNSRYGMAILDTRNVTAEQTSALFDVTLGEFLFFAQGAKTI